MFDLNHTHTSCKLVLRATARGSLKWKNIARNVCVAVTCTHISIIIYDRVVLLKISPLMSF